jgi:adenine deaminase
MLPLLRTSTAETSFPEILPPLLEKPFIDLAFCTDDIVPADILANGHMNRGIREAIRLGVDPAHAIRWATLVGARNFKIRDLGAIAPGYLADIILLDSLQMVQTSEVIVGGELIVQNGKLLNAIQEPASAIQVEGSVHLQPLTKDSFKIKPPDGVNEIGINVLVFSDDFLTDSELCQAKVENGELVFDSISEDACILSVVPRHGQSHPPSLSVMKRFGLMSGAMASSISHDCHNIVVAGKSEADMLMAVQELERLGGGIVLVEEGEVLAQVHLSVAGLMSWKPAEEVAVETERFNKIAKEKGITFPHQMWALAFLALAVIPEVRITDFGLIDVRTQEFLPMFV